MKSMVWDKIQINLKYGFKGKGEPAGKIIPWMLRPVGVLMLSARRSSSAVFILPPAMHTWMVSTSTPLIKPFQSMLERGFGGIA
jgi:hypothetical protein